MIGLWQQWPTSSGSLSIQPTLRFSVSVSFAQGMSSLHESFGCRLNGCPLSNLLTDFPFCASLFIILDMDGNVNEWNNKTAEITGFTKEEALNRPLVTTFIMPKLRRSVQEVMDNALQGNETSNYELGEDSMCVWITLDRFVLFPS